MLLLYVPFKNQCLSAISSCSKPPSAIPVLLYINDRSTTDKFCIHFHGNACDIGQISGCAVKEGTALNSHYMLVEYPKFGISRGYSNEETLNSVAKSVYDFVKEELNIPHDRIILIGRSIGTGPTCALASYLQLNKTPPAAVVLQSPFTSICDATADLLGGLNYLMVNRWENWRKLIPAYKGDKGVIQCPVLFIHADNDKVIHCNHSKLMHEHRSDAGLPSELFIQKSHGSFIKSHNFFSYEHDVIAPTKAFIAQVQLMRRSQLVLPSDVLDVYKVVPTEILELEEKIERRKASKSPLEEERTMKNDPRNPKDMKKNLFQKCTCMDYCSWSCCLCSFCLEGCCGCFSHSFNYCISLCVAPSFNYQKLRPTDMTVGSVGSLIYKRRSLEKALNQERSSKKQSDVDVPVTTVGADGSEDRVVGKRRGKEPYTYEPKDIRNPLLYTGKEEKSEKESSEGNLTFIPG